MRCNECICECVHKSKRQSLVQLSSCPACCIRLLHFAACYVKRMQHVGCCCSCRCRQLTAEEKLHEAMEAGEAMTVVRGAGCRVTWFGRIWGA
jgi:hypothetical protein